MKALIVDDDVVSRMALGELLSVYGVFDPVEAEDGEAAWTLLEAGLRPVICFCDVRMPRMSGIDLLKKMKSRADLAMLPFVLVSSASDRETVLQAVTLGAVGYILKPLHAADARAHLEKIFRLTLDKLAEDPVATCARLNIGTERLQAYLAAFAVQLEAGRGELDGLLAFDAALRITAFHAGCITLGLWQAAAALDAARAGAGDSNHLAIESALDAVRRQADRMRAANAMRGSGALV